MANIKSIQDKYATDDAIARLGETQQDFTNVGNLPQTAKLLFDAAELFIKTAQKNLDKSGSISTGAISDGLSRGALEYTSTSVAISVGYLNKAKAGSYYDYINKGVKGTKGNQLYSTPYSFETDYPNKKMAKAIKGWLRNNRSAGLREDQRFKLSKLQRKRKAIVQMTAEEKLDRLAYAVSVGIKRKGIKRTKFFDNALDTAFGAEFVKAVAATVGTDIAIVITQANKRRNA